MKRLFIGILLLLFAYTTITAQVIKSLSVSGGYGFASQKRYIDYTFKINYDPISSFNFAVGASFWQSKHFEISSTVGYIRKGYQFDFPQTTELQPEGTGKTITDRTTLKYIYIAPKIAYTYTLKKWVPFAFIAPRVDFFLSATEKQFLNDKVIFEDKEGRGGAIDYYNTYHKDAVFGFNTGLGVERKISERLAANIEFTYWFDVSKPVNIKHTDNIVASHSRNKAFTTSLALKYFFAKH